MSGGNDAIGTLRRWPAPPVCFVRPQGGGARVSCRERQLQSLSAQPLGAINRAPTMNRVCVGARLIAPSRRAPQSSRLGPGLSRQALQGRGQAMACWPFPRLASTARRGNGAVGITASYVNCAVGSSFSTSSPRARPRASSSAASAASDSASSLPIFSSSRADAKAPEKVVTHRLPRLEQHSPTTKEIRGFLTNHLYPDFLDRPRSLRSR